ncbi:MAG: hypothetical protein M3R69_13135 [Acidobacteriota bacterium]|nr:hypothetical protein [Acidobacteriota bacterium]
MQGHYQTEKEIEEVVLGFESCTTGVDRFKHREHLAVAVWYLRNSSPEEAFQKMCAGLLRFLDHHGVSRNPYNEELTKSWINLIQRTLDQMDPELSLLEATNMVVERLGDKRAVFDDSNNT